MQVGRSTPFSAGLGGGSKGSSSALASGERERGAQGCRAKPSRYSYLALYPSLSLNFCLIPPQFAPQRRGELPWGSTPKSLIPSWWLSCKQRPSGKLEGVPEKSPLGRQWGWVGVEMGALKGSGQVRAPLTPVPVPGAAA